MAGDKVSLAIGMSGLATELLFAGRSQGSRLASEQMALLKSMDDPNLTIGLSFVAFANWFSVGEFGEIVRWSQTIIDLAAGDPAKGAGFGLGSPLAITLAFRGVARWWLGRPGWRQDLHDAVAMARQSDPKTIAIVATWTYGLAIVYGCFGPMTPRCAQSRRRSDRPTGKQRSRSDLRRVHAGCRTAESGRCGRPSPRAGHHGAGSRVAARAYALPGPGQRVVGRPGEGQARRPRCRHTGDTPRRGRVHEAGRLGYGVWGTGLRVETLLERGAEGDLAEAQQAIDWFANLSKITVRRFLRSRCCGCAHSWPKPNEMRPPIATIATATARWRHPLASRGT